MADGNDPDDRTAGARSPLSRLKLRQLLFSHKAVTDAAVERLVGRLSDEDGALHWRSEVSEDRIFVAVDDDELIFRNDFYEFRFPDPAIDFIDDLPDAGHPRPPLEGSLWSRELIHSLALEVRNAALKAFTLVVKSGRLQLYGCWDDFRNPIEKVPPHAWPDHPELMLKHGHLSILNGTLKLPNGQTVNSIEIEPTEERSATLPEKGSATGRRTIKSQIDFERELESIIDASPHKRSMKNAVILALAAKRDVSWRAAGRIKATILNRKSAEIQKAWAGGGRPRGSKKASKKI